MAYVMNWVVLIVIVAAGMYLFKRAKGRWPWE